MRHQKSLALAAILAFALPFAACDGNPAGGDNSRVSVLLTDAPGDFAIADVEILEVYLQGSDGESDAEDGGRVVLFSGSKDFDLLTLRDGVTAELAELSVPSGHYHQLRLVVGDVSIETDDGEVYSTENGTLHCPSCAQSGLKINLPGGGIHLDGGDHSIIIDFDVAQSFGRLRGNSGRWVMHPVINATRGEAASSITGVVTLADGVVLPVCGGSQTAITVFKPTAVAGDLSLSATTNADGTFRFPYAAAGAYTIGYAATYDFNNDQRLTIVATPSVSVLDLLTGTTGAVNYVITSATCADIPPTT